MSDIGTIKPMAQDRRFGELDALRGIAAASVMLYHYLIAFPKFYADDLGLTFTPFAAYPETRDLIGTYPVILFFMISGFVILMSVSRGKGVGAFAFSRFARLFPVFWAAVLLTFTVGLLAPLPDQNLTTGQLLGNLTMIPERVGVLPLDHVYWSLAYELQFYGLVALVMLAGLGARWRLVCTAWLAIDLVMVLNQAMGLALPEGWYGLLNAPFAPFFVAGICFYRRSQGQTDRATTHLLAASAALVLISFPLWFALACLCFWLIFHLGLGGHLRWLAVRPLLFLGTISYALYLSHMMIGFRIMYWLQEAGLAYSLSVITAIALSLALAVAMTFAVERPAQRVLRRWYRRRQDRTADPAPATAH